MGELEKLIEKQMQQRVQPNGALQHYIQLQQQGEDGETKTQYSPVEIETFKVLIECMGLLGAILEVLTKGDKDETPDV